MNQTVNLEQIRQESLKQQTELNQWLKKLEEEQKNRPRLFTMPVVFWIICFLAMIGSLIYKQTFLTSYSDDWRFFSAIHVITALICIAGITYHNLTTQEVFDKDVLEIDELKNHVPLIMKDNRIYANDRENYEQVLDRIIEYIKLAKFLYFFGVIALATIFFIWDITQYFLVPDAYVVQLSTDPGWKTTAYQIYFPGLFISGGAVLASVMIREIVKINAKFFALILHISGLMTTVLKSKQLRADQNN